MSYITFENAGFFVHYNDGDKNLVANLCYDGNIYLAEERCGSERTRWVKTSLLRNQTNLLKEAIRAFKQYEEGKASPDRNVGLWRCNCDNLLIYRKAYGAEKPHDWWLKKL